LINGGAEHGTRAGRSTKHERPMTPFRLSRRTMSRVMLFRPYGSGRRSGEATEAVNGVPQQNG
jgi:hypothetical protein